MANHRRTRQNDVGHGIMDFRDTRAQENDQVATILEDRAMTEAGTGPAATPALEESKADRKSVV